MRGLFLFFVFFSSAINVAKKIVEADVSRPSPLFSWIIPLIVINHASWLLRLNSSDEDGEPLYIQMVTALVLQLIQCVVHLPNDKDTFEDCDKVGEEIDKQNHHANRQIYN